VGTVQQLAQQINEITRKTLYSAVIGRGGIQIDSSGSLKVTNGVSGLGQFYIGGGSTAPAHADGSSQIITNIGDEAGRDRLILWDDNTPASTTNQRFYEYDVGGRLIRTQDSNGGWATPWFSVPMYTRFHPNGGPGSYNSDGFYYSGGFAQFTAGSNNCISGQDYWEGRIPFVSHPRISVDGVWGGSANPTYTLYLNGSSVGSYSPGTGVTATSWGPFDITSLLTKKAVSVQIKISFGAGVVAADCLGVYLRQT
jgi:hypothetical protein